MKRILFTSDMRVGGGGLGVRDIRAMAKENPALFMERVQHLIDSDKLTLKSFRSLAPLFVALEGIKVPVRMDMMGGMAVRTIDAAAFPILTGSLVIKGINDAYASVPTIGQELVTEIDDDKKVTTLAAVYEDDKGVEEVKELDQFPEVGAHEEKVEIRHKIIQRVFLNFCIMRIENQKSFFRFFLIFAFYKKRGNVFGYVHAVNALEFAKRNEAVKAVEQDVFGR